MISRILQARTREAHTGSPSTGTLSAAAAATLLATLGCNSTDSASQTDVPAGTYDATTGFFVDESFNGEAAQVRIRRQFYGRLVDIAWTTNLAGGAPVNIAHTDFVVDPRVDSGWTGPYQLRTNQITGRQTLVIEADFDDTVGSNGQAPGREQFISLLAQAESGVRPISDNGFVGAGTFTMVPRNAAIVIVFDDLIEPATINAQSVRLLVGEPTIIPFEARVFPDSNHGALADFDGIPGQEFYPTRMIIDPAISEEESFQASITANALGLPASSDVTLANIEVRMPSISLNNQPNTVIQNPTEHELSSVAGDNGTIDFGTSQRELVRAFRSGGLTSVTADPFNGVLPDDTAPSLVGSQAGIIRNLSVVDPADLSYEVDLFFTNGACAQPPTGGDIVVQGSFFAEVLPPPNMVDDTYILQSNDSAVDVRVRLISFPDTFTDPNEYLQSESLPIQFLTPFVEGEDDARAGCFLTVSPAPDFDNLVPIISPSATLSVRFNEAIDPDLFEPYESFTLVRQQLAFDPNDASTLSPAEEASDYVPGAVLNNVSFREFRFLPSVPLNTLQAGYSLDLGRGANAPRDFAGNPVPSIPNAIPIRVQTISPELTGGRVIRFTGADEEFPFADLDDPNGDPLVFPPQPEFNGQATYDLERGRLRGRPVVRQQAVVSTSNDLPATMTVGPGTSLPLNPFGARTQIIWRYIDFAGLPLNEDNDITKDLDLPALNIDVEGVSLSPLGGNPVFESFPEFQMSMAHSVFAPDEVINPQTGALIFPQSGLQTNFTNNLLDPVNDPLQEVHARSAGYVINPGDQTSSSDGTPLLPLPMNSGVPAEQFRYYTWRDTALAARGGPNGNGVPPARVAQITGVGPVTEFIDPCLGPLCGIPGDPNPFFDPDEVRSAVLPLLIDFRCYPTGGAASGNIFSHQLAHASTLPGFRAFSGGGRNEAGTLILVDPDQENTANGGFDPTSTPAGATVPGLDNVVYLGAIDLVTRVSRVTSIFYPALDPISRDGDPLTQDLTTYAAPSFAEPAIFPAEQPQGTRIELAYRGAGTIPAGDISTRNAARSDYYGDFYLSRPILFDPVTQDGFQGGASCFDGSFDYLVADENTGLPFLNNNNSWRDSIDEIESAQWFQVRISFISNPATTVVPEISAIGFAWEQN